MRNVKVSIIEWLRWYIGDGGGVKKTPQIEISLKFSLYLPLVELHTNFHSTDTIFKCKKQVKLKIQLNTVKYSIIL